MEKRILLVEDNNDIARQIKQYLEKYEYTVDIAPTYLVALNKINIFYDLALVDINLPDGNGKNLISKLNEKNIRVIITTVKNNEDFIVKCLDEGADDYLTKPFSLNILRARIDATLRTVQLESGEEIKHKDLVLLKNKYQIKYRNNIVELTSLEFEILSMFVQNPNRVYTRGQLLEMFWEDRDKFVTDNTLTATIKKIREKTNKDLIITVRGIGYRMG